MMPPAVRSPQLNNCEHRSLAAGASKANGHYARARTQSEEAASRAAIAERLRAALHAGLFRRHRLLLWEAL